MAWLKKNWMVVAVIAAGVAMLGGSLYFLYSKYSLAKDVAAQLQSQTQELERLSRLKPHPGNDRVDNIAAAKKQTEQVRKLIEEFKKVYTPIDYPTNLSSGQFKLRLDRTIAELRRYAKQSGVRLPKDYAFSFENIRNQMSFEPKDIPTLSRVLAEIETITKIVCDAKVLALDGIRRMQVIGRGDTNATASAPFGASSSSSSSYSPYGAGPTGGGAFWERTAVTNDLAILTPYEFTFHCFTGELAAFLDGIQKSPHWLLVKNVAVDHSPSSLLQTPGMWGMSGRMPGAGMGAHGGGPLDRQIAARYGLGPGGPPGAPVPGMLPGPRFVNGRMIVLDEQPFRVRAWVYAVRLLSPEEAQALKAAGAMSPAGGGMGPAAAPAMPSRYAPPTIQVAPGQFVPYEEHR